MDKPIRPLAPQKGSSEGPGVLPPGIRASLVQTGGWRLDVSTRQLSWTPELGRLLEVSPEFHPTAESILGFFDEADQVHLISAYRRAMQSGEPWDLELPMTTAMGHRRWVRAIGQRETRDGRPSALVGVIQDMTEQQRDHDLRDQLLEILCASADIVVMATADGRVVWCNRVDFLPGESEEEWIFDLHPDWAAKLLAEEALPTAAREGLWAGQSAIRGEGGEIGVHQTVIAHRDHDGQVIRYSTVIRSRAEQAAQDAEQRLQGIVGCLEKEIVWSWNLEGTRFLHLSPAAASVLGRPMEELLACPGSWAPYIHAEDQARLSQAADRIVETGGYSEACRIVRPDESMRHVEIRHRLVRDEGGTAVRFDGVILDITDSVMLHEERERMQQRLQTVARLESIGLLASCVSHDFNNLLVGLLSSAELALMDLPTGSPAREHVEMIERTAVRAAELTRQLLTYSGRSDPRAELLQLAELVGEMNTLLRRAVDQNVRFEMDLEGELPSILGDNTQIRQVVMNLITNASDAVRAKGGGKVHLRTTCGEVGAERLSAAVAAEAATAGRYVIVTVKDDGTGLPVEHAASIFDPFFTTKEEGHGLGLAAVLGIIKSHRGFIEVDSRPGEGTTFHVGFPAATTTEPKTPPSAPPRIPEEARRNMKSVLIVDDEEIVRNVLQRILKRLKYTPATVTRGAEAVDYMRSHADEIGLVLLDVTMPGIDGLETARMLGEIAPRTPILLMSGYSEHEAQATESLPNVVGFLPKPFRSAELSAKIQAILEA